MFSSKLLQDKVILKMIMEAESWVVLMFKVTSLYTVHVKYLSTL